MIQVLILYDVDGWAYHSRALALERFCPEGFRVRIGGMESSTSQHAKPHDQADEAAWTRLRLLEILGDQKPDVILCLCSFLAKPVRRLLNELHWDSRLIAASNNGWPRRSDHFETLFDYADWVVVNNQEYLEKSGRTKRCSAIANGVDLSNFYLEKPISNRAPKVIWCGSELYRDIKGFDDFIVPIFEQLSREGIDCEALLVNSRGQDRFSREQMREWYNGATVLVCASETEGTPNTALEAACCGCTLVSTRVGNMPELIRHGHSGVLVERTREDILAGIRFAVDHHVEMAQSLFRDIQGWNWRRRAGEYFDLFANVLDLDIQQIDASQIPKPPASTADATENKVTVFVSTVNSPSFSECMRHLAAQDCGFRLEVIENVAPMSAAFQEMIDRCETPYYVQVDEDMLLMPHAIRTLHEAIAVSPSDNAFVVRLLWDCHLKRAIQGVKIYRHSIVNKFPYRNVQSCERDQVTRLEAAGYRVGRPQNDMVEQDHADVLGFHGMYFQPESVYERYFTLMQKKHKFPGKLKWIDRHLIDFFERFKADPSEFNLMAILGVLAGHMLGHHADKDAGEKDFRNYQDLPGLQLARDFYAQCSTANLNKNLDRSAL